MVGEIDSFVKFSHKLICCTPLRHSDYKVTKNTSLIIVAPPDKTAFESHNTAIQALHAWKKAHGFNITKRGAEHADKENTIGWKPRIDCDRGKTKSELST